MCFYYILQSTDINLKHWKKKSCLMRLGSDICYFRILQVQLSKNYINIFHQSAKYSEVTRILKTVLRIQHQIYESV